MHLSFVLPELIVLALLNVQALANFDLAKRLVCVKDDLYDGFHNADPEDINPWCSSYLGIPEYTATRVGGTSRTTVITTDTTFTPYFTTTTVPSYLTTTTITLDALKKRDAAPAPTPAPALDQLYQAAPIIQLCDESEANKSVIASVSSACSCLFVSPRTVDVSVTKTVTRTESAIDYESTPIYVTRSSNATLTETVYPTYNSTLPGTSGMFSTFDSVSSSSSSPFVSGGPAPSQNTSTYPPGLSTAPTSIDLGTTSSTSSASLSTQSCPTQDTLIQDGSIIAQRDGEQFQVLCFTNFPGPTYVGLDQPTYRSCLQQCALSNDGFSVIRCYGISFFPKRIGANCYLKDQAGVANPDYNPNYRVVSGILLQNSTGNFSSTLSSSSTPIPALSSSLNSGPTGPTAISSAPIPITNSTSPSLSPVPSVNGTNAPSVTPSPSFNVTSLPSSSPTDYDNTPPDMTESGDPRSRHQSPSSGSSGFPIPSANVTSGSPINSANATISGFPIPTINTTASGFPTPPANITSGFPTPTGNETSGSPTPSANLTSSGFPTPSSNGTSGFPSPTINGTSSGFPTPSGNASICLTTDWVTAYTTQEVCLSYITVYTTTSAPPKSLASTRTITQTYTIEVNGRQKRPRTILGF